MNWIAQRGRAILLHVAVPAEFLEWLAAHSRDPAILQIDPYRDLTLDAAQQSSWLRALRDVRAGAAAALRRHHEDRSHLPRDPDARAGVLDRLLAVELSRDARHRTLDDLCALLELALDTGAEVRAIGD